MKLHELKNKIQEYQYMEDTGVIDVSIASILSNQLQLGDPVWMLIIGASSGGKSQILRPISMSTGLAHRVDDLTENTLLSGITTTDPTKSPSLLHKIGNHGVIVISDFTVIMSKNSESRNAILSQFRMLYDGEMTKHIGNKPEPVTWKGYLGMFAGSTPSVYKHFEEVADMGERFIYYRMKEFSKEKATRLAISTTINTKQIDVILSEAYKEYMTSVAQTYLSIKDTMVISDKMQDRIIEVAMFAERARTNASKDWQGNINRIPVCAFPMRVAKQLQSIARAMAIMRYHESGSFEYDESDYTCIDWIGYSLANEENRACLKFIASHVYDGYHTTSSVADAVGLDTSIVRGILQNMAALKILKRNGTEGSLGWSFDNENEYNIVRRIEHISVDLEIVNREQTDEDIEGEASQHINMDEWKV